MCRDSKTMSLKSDACFESVNDISFVSPTRYFLINPFSSNDDNDLLTIDGNDFVLLQRWLTLTLPSVLIVSRYLISLSVRLNLFIPYTLYQYCYKVYKYITYLIQNTTFRL